MIEAPFHLQCLDDNGMVIARVGVVNGSLIVVGDMRAWRDTAAELLPILRETTANFPR
jgi:hypothetical protein